MQKTPCQMGYNCPYCKVVDNLHIVQFGTKCPIEWEVYEETVRDTYTDEVMPFVARPQSKQREDDGSPFLLPILEYHSGKKRQVGLYRV